MSVSNLRLGVIAEEVKALQAKLQQRGLSIPYGEAAKNYFGPGTQQALLLFQRSRGLPLTGVVDQRTAVDLNRAVEADPPSATPAAPDPGPWFLKQTGPGVWGTGTDMAGRTQPWDTNCKVTPLIGGFATMTSICADLETAIKEAQTSGKPPGKCGYIYVTDWRLDPLRDLSSNNNWSTGPWGSGSTIVPPQTDQTAIGLFVRALDAGIKVRIMVWFPTSLQSLPTNVLQHFQEHVYLYSVIQQKSNDMVGRAAPAGLGVVLLDTRVGGTSGTHHQKMMIIRGATSIYVAYCGGVDLAFTRRDAPSASPGGAIAPPSGPQFNGGDWQSGSGMPDPAVWIKQPNGPNGPLYPIVTPGAVPSLKMGTDLPNGSDSDNPNVYAATNQIWHDQHLKLEGPIVQTLERQFRERWTDSAGPGYAQVIPGSIDDFSDNVFVSDASAVIGGVSTNGTLVPLDTLDPPSDITLAQLPSGPGSSLVQMWRTIPIRNRGTSPSIFATGEFSNLSGIANACTQATQLIWIFDQYFWSRPLARLLNSLLLSSDPTKSGLCVIIILPPYYDSSQGMERYLRNLAFYQLTLNATNSLFQRIGVYNLWHKSLNQGIYCHAKAQIYDESLLVCGSCNLNQRSFLCDTELDCAVQDPDVVASHQTALWQLLFPNVSPALNLSAAGSGTGFLSQFKQAVVSSGSFLIADKDFYVPQPVTLVPGITFPSVVVQGGTPTGGWVSPDGWTAPSAPNPPKPGWVDPPDMSPTLTNMADWLPDPTSLDQESFGSDYANANTELTLQAISNLLINDDPAKPAWRK